MSEPSSKTPSPRKSPQDSAQESTYLTNPPSEIPSEAEPRLPLEELQPPLFLPQPLTSGDIARLSDLPSPTVRRYSSPKPEDQPSARNTKMTSTSAKQSIQQSQPQLSRQLPYPEDPDTSNSYLYQQSDKMSNTAQAEPSILQPTAPAAFSNRSNSSSDNQGGDSGGGNNNDRSTNTNSENSEDEDRILGGMTMAWTGTTADGVQLCRRDTWAAGHRWRRHVRVIEGFPKAELSTGTSHGVERHGTW